MRNYITRIFHGTKDQIEFLSGIQLAINQVKPDGVFLGDNMFTFGKNLSFLDDVSFVNAFVKHTQNKNPQLHEVSQSIIWRTHVLSWAASGCANLEGDFVECGCYKGTSAKIICEYLDFNKTGKHYYLYDLFEHKEGMDHHGMFEHDSSLYEVVKHRFIGNHNVHVIKGSVPETLHTSAPEKIAFMHLDLNSAVAELGALEFLFDRIVTGGILVLDDYGWLDYKPQKEVEDIFFAERGYRVLELPTGQGMVIK